MSVMKMTTDFARNNALEQSAWAVLPLRYVYVVATIVASAIFGFVVGLYF